MAAVHLHLLVLLLWRQEGELRLERAWARIYLRCLAEVVRVRRPGVAALQCVVASGGRRGRCALRVTEGFVRRGAVRGSGVGGVVSLVSVW